MQRKDKHDKPERNTEYAIKDMSPSQRIAMVIKLSEIACPSAHNTEVMTAEQWRRKRENWPT